MRTVLLLLFLAQNRTAWNLPQKPFRVYGNTYYVGPHGLTSLLITSPAGHILIDGALPESASQIVANIKTLGFRIEDVKLILNTHPHYDHAGGLAELQKLSGAPVAASPWSTPVLTLRADPLDDPQHGTLSPIAPLARVRTLHDAEILSVGPVTITAHFTPGHTPGGTTWTWQSCENARCLNVVYADSLSPVSAPGYHFNTDSAKSFERSYAFLETVPCDILITPHPEASHLWDRLDNPVDPGACRALATASRAQLKTRLATQK